MKTMESTSSVCILMSTYNGIKYIREQLDSLLAQEVVTMTIVIRDDGSSDATIDIISEYAISNKNIILLKGQNCGAEESFNILCQYALNNVPSDYYAFCDQDDVWDSDKLNVAVHKLNEFDDQKPNLYFSNLRIVDQNLNYIKDLYTKTQVFTERSKTLVQIFTYGCTCVFNHKALEYYCLPKHQSTFHDNWIYCVCSYFGNVYYDSIGHIMYRQHENNLSGSNGPDGISLMIKRIKRLFKGHLGHDFEIMASQLLLMKENMEIEDYNIVKHVSNYRKNIFSRLYLFFSIKYTTGNFIKDLCIRFRILCNSL